MENNLDVKRKCVVLWDGSEIWIEWERAEKLEQMLIEQKTSNFFRIKEIGRTVSTGEIEQICTPEQMEDRRRTARKEWKCESGNWHQKKDVCDCVQKAREAAAKEREAARIAEMSRPLTPEEQKRSAENWRKIREHMEGVFASKKMK